MRDDYLDVLRNRKKDEYMGSFETKETRAIEQIKTRLTPLQNKFFEALSWYYFGSRGSGRTYLTCAVLVCRALENPGHRIYLQDHHNLNDRSYRQWFYGALEAFIFQNLPKHIAVNFDVKRNYLVYGFDEDISLALKQKGEE